VTRTQVVDVLDDGLWFADRLSSVKSSLVSSDSSSLTGQHHHMTQYNQSQHNSSSLFMLWSLETASLILAWRGCSTWNYIGSTFPTRSCSSWCSAVFTVKHLATASMTRLSLYCLAFSVAGTSVWNSQYHQITSDLAWYIDPLNAMRHWRRIYFYADPIRVSLTFV